MYLSNMMRQIKVNIKHWYIKHKKVSCRGTPDRCETFNYLNIEIILFI